MEPLNLGITDHLLGESGLGKESDQVFSLPSEKYLGRRVHCVIEVFSFVTPKLTKFSPEGSFGIFIADFQWI